MREIAEFHVYERHAHLLFAPDEGKRVGDDMREVHVDTTDPRFPEIGGIQRELRSGGVSAVFGGGGGGDHVGAAWV